METKSSASHSSKPQWYIFKDCHQHGPLDSDEICKLLANNQITKDHHIWHIDFNDWVAIKDVEAFQNVGFGAPFSKEKTPFVETQPKTETSTTSMQKSLWQKLKGIFKA